MYWWRLLKTQLFGGPPRWIPAFAGVKIEVDPRVKPEDDETRVLSDNKRGNHAKNPYQ